MDHELKASLGYTARSYLKQQQIYVASSKYIVVLVLFLLQFFLFGIGVEPSRALLILVYAELDPESVSLFM